MSIRFVFAKIQINHEYGKEIVLFNQFFGEATYPVARCNACRIKAPSDSSPSPQSTLRLLPSPSDSSPSTLRLLPRCTLLGEKLKNNDEMDGMAPLSDNRNRGLIWSVIPNQALITL